MTIDTHEVANQPPPFVGYDAWSQDALLRATVVREGGEWVHERAHALGKIVGGEYLQTLAAQANRYTPELKTHDRYGHRTDSVEFHPAYHELMSIAFGAGCHSLAWTAQRRNQQGAFVARAALNYLWNQGEQGVSCPVTMTFASVRVLRNAPDIAREWEPKILTEDYDRRPLPISEKRAATVGMAMTEKQGGSDLRATQTIARPVAGGLFALTGHKWFCSAPMSDGFLTLARLDAGVTCFFVPRSLPDGIRNRFLLQRLKDKCGNRSNASAEVEYDDTLAWIIGEPGRGIATLIEMAHLTRFDIVVAAAGMMRTMFNQALHHTAHRSAFGARLAQHALMQNVLADLAIEVEAAMLLAFRLARGFDRASSDGHERRITRILTSIAKYWLCKRLPAVALETMECFGGNGYVEEFPMARLYREAPLNGIWEGSANVICLDILRIIQKEPEALEALFTELGSCSDERVTGHVAATRRLLASSATLEVSARQIVERIALALQATLMLEHSAHANAQAFCGSRLDAAGGYAFGTLPVGIDRAAIIERARLA